LKKITSRFVDEETYGFDLYAGAHANLHISEPGLTTPDLRLRKLLVLSPSRPANANSSSQAKVPPAVSSLRRLQFKHFLIVSPLCLRYLVTGGDLMLLARVRQITDPASIVWFALFSDGSIALLNRIGRLCTDVLLDCGGCGTDKKTTVRDRTISGCILCSWLTRLKRSAIRAMRCGLAQPSSSGTLHYL
jgi:hypothetical protein